MKICASHATLVIGMLVFFNADDALAQDPVKAKSGEEVRLAALGSMKADCRANPAPEVRMSQNAAHGVIRIVSAKMTTNRFPKCPRATLPVKVIFYKSSPQYKGNDRIELEINQGGKVSKRAIDIKVE